MTLVREARAIPASKLCVCVGGVTGQGLYISTAISSRRLLDYFKGLQVNYARTEGFPSCLASSKDHPPCTVPVSRLSAGNGQGSINMKWGS
jgi:hypothetical protein